MPVLNHTIVASRDHRHAAAFAAELLGVPAPTTLGHFEAVRVGDATTLDFVQVDGPINSQHHAFLVTEAELDEIFGRIDNTGMPYWADPGHDRPGEINIWDGRRGVYFDDPSGHRLEIITRPYGTGGTTTTNPPPPPGRRQTKGLTRDATADCADPIVDRPTWIPRWWG